MLTYCVRRLILRRENIPKTSRCMIAFAVQRDRDYTTATGSRAEDSDHVETLLKLCSARYYIASGQVHRDSFQRGTGCVYGPLGMELRKNILDQWWNSVMRSRAQVFGISTLHTSKDGPLKLVDSEALRKVLNQRGLSKNELVKQLSTLLQNSSSARTSLLDGALEQYVSSLELVNRKLPFGLAEAGLCLQPSDGSGCPAEVTQSSLVWFCSTTTSSQWLDYWARQRLQWWRKFALSPSDFSSIDLTEEELGGEASRGVRIVYSFPWGPQALETLLSRGDKDLLQTQCGDGMKSVVPHVVTVTGNMDLGVLAYLYNSLQQIKKVDRKQKLKRKVLKLHPVLAPVKVALDMGTVATVEGRQVCEGLLQEFLEEGLSAWPGYLETIPSSMEQLNTKYDEMGVLFTMVIGENTLESGLLQVRSRDTTIKETMHISEVKNYVSRYISAADNI